MQAHGLFAQITFWFARNHVFVGKEIDGFELRQINYLRSELKQGYWAAGWSLWWLPA